MMTPAGSFFPHPEGMSEDAAELWRHIVDAHPRGYFQAGDVPLLRAYCEEPLARGAREQQQFFEPAGDKAASVREQPHQRQGCREA